eukprot:394006_1
MGVCNSTVPTDKNTQEIEKLLNDEYRKEKQAKRLVLLGTHLSGKSTLLQQLEYVYKYGYEIKDDEINSFNHKLRERIMSTIITLLYKSQELYDSNPNEFSDCLVDIDMDTHQIITSFMKYTAQFSITKETANLLVLGYVHKYENMTNSFIPSEIISNIMEFQDVLFEELRHELKQLGEFIGILWDLNAIQNTFSHRFGKYCLPDNMDYFLDQTENIFTFGFIPTYDDILKCNFRMREIEDTFYQQHNIVLNILIASDNCNTWKMFEGIAAVIYIAALNDFCKVLFENEEKNAMHESIELFDKVCNSKWFGKSEIILFLNKSDLFRECLYNGHLLKECFTIEHGWNEWNLNNDNIKEDNELFEKYFDSCISFITDQYVQRMRNPHKRVFVHVTNATSGDCIQKVFWNVQNIVVRCNLPRGGS